MQKIKFFAENYRSVVCREELHVAERLYSRMHENPTNIFFICQSKEEELRLTERNIQASKKNQNTFEVQMNALRNQKVCINSELICVKVMFYYMRKSLETTSRKARQPRANQTESQNEKAKVWREPVIT